MEGGSQGSYWCAHAAVSSLFFLWVVLFLTHTESGNIITLKEMVIRFQKEPSRRLGQQHREWSREEPVSQPRWVAGEARGVATILAIILLSCQDESHSFIVFLKKHPWDDLLCGAANTKPCGFGPQLSFCVGAVENFPWQWLHAFTHMFQLSIFEAALIKKK